LWISRAMTSLPVPLSPSISTGMSWLAHLYVFCKGGVPRSASRPTNQSGTDKIKIATQAA
jgi:hypothetical protein